MSPTPAVPFPFWSKEVGSPPGDATSALAPVAAPHPADLDVNTRLEAPHSFARHQQPTTRAPGQVPKPRKRLADMRRTPHIRPWNNLPPTTMRPTPHKQDEALAASAHSRHCGYAENSAYPQCYGGAIFSPALGSSELAQFCISGCEWRRGRPCTPGSGIPPSMMSRCRAEGSGHEFL